MKENDLLQLNSLHGQQLVYYWPLNDFDGFIQANTQKRTRNESEDVRRRTISKAFSILRGASGAHSATNDQTKLLLFSPCPLVSYKNDEERFHDSLDLRMFGIIIQYITYRNRTKKN